MIARLLLAVPALAAAGASTAPDHPMPPPVAVALADAAHHPQRGRFEMMVAAAGENNGTTYLNSEADYRSPTDLTFELKPNVVRSLTKRFGEAPASFLRGRRVVVDGVVGRKLIVNVVHGRPVSANRWQHTVRVQQAAQIVAIR